MSGEPIHCNACGETMVDYVMKKKPYVTIVRGDGTGTLFHWACVFVVERKADAKGLHPRFTLGKV